MQEAIKKRIIFWIIFIIALVLSLVVLSFLSIYTSTKDACINARAKYHQDCVQSLIAVAKSKQSSFYEKNTAIWALGQLADSRALIFLNGLNNRLNYNQGPCIYNQEFCKHEVEKALNYCYHGNFTNWMYHNSLHWQKEKLHK